MTSRPPSGVMRGAAHDPETLVILMAGGLGTRLEGLTRDRPKPLLHVGPKPILETLLEQLVAQGFSRFLMAVHYRAEMIVDHFGDGARWGVEIAYLRERERLGTAGALSLLREPTTTSVLVANGDLLTAIDFRALLDAHAASGAAATMVVRPFDLHVPFGVAETEGSRLTRLAEKPVYRFFINAGIYVLEPESLALVPRDRSYDMTELFEELLRRRMHAATYLTHEYWQDVGRISDLQEATAAYDAIFARADDPEQG